MSSYTNGRGEYYSSFGTSPKEKREKARIAAGLPAKDTRQEMADNAQAAWNEIHADLEELRVRARNGAELALDKEIEELESRKLDYSDGYLNSDNLDRWARGYFSLEKWSKRCFRMG